MSLWEQRVTVTYRVAASLTGRTSSLLYCTLLNQYLSEGSFGRDMFLKLRFIHVRSPLKPFMALGCKAREC